MIFKTNNLILSIYSNNFEIKKFKEYGSFLIKLIDLKTQNDYILDFLRYLVIYAEKLIKIFKHK